MPIPRLKRSTLVVVQVLVAREAQVIRLRRMDIAVKLEEQQQHAAIMTPPLTESSVAATATVIDFVRSPPRASVGAVRR